MGFPNSIYTYALSLLFASASLFAGVASCAQPSPGDPVALFQPCRSARAPSLSLTLPLPGDLSSFRSSEFMRCGENDFSFSCTMRSPAGLAKTQVASASSAPQPKLTAPEHRFWDRENDLLFTAVAASRTLDYFSTLNFRRRGRDEVFLTNDIVDNHAAFAAIEAGGTAVSIGVSYLFHRSHHHRLERWASIIHASLSTTGAVRNYCLKTAHP